MNKLSFCTIILFLFTLNTIKAQKVNTQLLQKENWVLEAQSKDSTFLNWKKNHVTIDSKEGTTLWLNKKLTGHYIVEYDRKIIDKNVHFIRMSDINQFWAAQLEDANPFTQNGAFESYDSLQLLYFGFGGNSNKTTRFRQYDGKGNRILLKEYTDYNHLIKIDSTYHIKTEVNKNNTRVWINGNLYFDYSFPEKIAAGYFGIRLTWSAQYISNFTLTTF